MNSAITAFALSAVLAPPDALDAESKAKQTNSQPAIANTVEPAEVSAELRGFSGLLLGRLVSKDIERGELKLTVDHVPRIWRGSTASKPRSAIGKTFHVEGVAGKWLDNLLLIRPGETLMIEVNHQRGDRLKFIPEMLEKTAPFDPRRFPIPPDPFRGFRGTVTGRIVQKLESSRELALNVATIEKASSENRAANPKSVVGKPITVAGFWVGGLRNTFDGLKVGDFVRTDLRHRVPQSDHFTAIALTKLDKGQQPIAQSPDKSGFPVELEGLNGLVLGKLVSKDIERGEFKVTVDHVPRVWRGSKAKNPRAAVGRTFVVEGVFGKWLDNLLLVKPGETLLFEVQHRRGDRLTFPGELLERAAPFDPRKYPSPPEEFRGFRGIVTGIVDQKLENHLEMTLKITEIEKTFDGSTAQNPGSAVGNSVAIAGFWMAKFRKPYEAIKVGDKIRIGLIHRTPRSDHFMAGEVCEVADP